MNNRKFALDLFNLIKDKHYIYQLCDDLIELSKKLYGFPDYKYCQAMLFNSCVAPWFGDMPHFRKDVSELTRKFWVDTYTTSLKLGREYLNNKLCKGN